VTRRRLPPLVLAVLLCAAAPAAWAGFVTGASAAASFSTGALAPPASLSGTAQCRLLQHEVLLTWSATPSGWADGYEVSSATSASGPWTVVPRPVGADPLATSRTVGPLLSGTTYWFRVTATRGAWRSAPVQVTVTTPTLCLL
jgi:hypothetical protein